jgi:hypothetical protein
MDAIRSINYLPFHDDDGGDDGNDCEDDYDDYDVIFL